MGRDILKETDGILQEISSALLDASLARCKRAFERLMDSAAQDASAVDTDTCAIDMGNRDERAEWRSSLRYTPEGNVREHRVGYCLDDEGHTLDCNDPVERDHMPHGSWHEWDVYFVSPWDGCGIACTPNNESVLDNPPDGIQGWITCVT